ncbi:MAG: hypothetical protein O2931_17385 [Planctomycetota bacterium]|nr:hypothetical protein [Planctomycetota bacterium]MDA1180555.1 hypothetical protein [Planctomycetota bacterium]
MNFALLGADKELFRLAEVIAASSSHRIVALCDTGEWEPRLRRLFPTAQLESGVDGLLHHPQADAVIVNCAPFAADRDDALRKFAQAGQCLILTFPATTHLMALELEMIRADSGAQMITFLPDLEQFPAHLTATNDWDTEPTGVDRTSDDVETAGFEQVVWERAIDPSATRERVWMQLARDLLLTRLWMGPFRQVTAMSAENPSEANNINQQRLGHASVMAKTEKGRMARWSTAPQEAGVAKCRLSLTRDHATQTAVWDDSSDHWQFEAESPSSDSVSESRAAPQDDGQSYARLLDTWENNYKNNTTGIPWSTVCQALVMVDGLEYSLKRGRPVDLRNDLVTEEDSFKGIMAAAGCLLLLGVLMLLFVVAMVEALQLPLLQWSVWRKWPLYLLIPLLGFLSLQLLRLFVYRKETPR